MHHTAAIDATVTRGSQGSWHRGGRVVGVAGFGGVHVASEPRRGACADPETPHIVFLHGYIQTSWSWRHQLGPLAEHFDTHAVCLPGFGWSDKPRTASFRLAAQAERVLAVLETLDIRRTHLVGNSLGGALALQIALIAPALVGKLVLVNPAGPGRYPLAVLSGLQHEVLAPLVGLPGVPLALRLGLQHAAYANLEVDQAFLKTFLEPLRAPGAARAALNVARYFNRDLAATAARLRDVRQPCLLLWGQGDRIVPLETVEKMARDLPNSRLELYDRSGHCPMEEEPVRFNREVLAFLKAATR